MIINLCVIDLLPFDFTLLQKMLTHEDVDKIKVIHMAIDYGLAKGQK